MQPIRAALAHEAIRIVTWNIHGAVGADRRCDPERIASVINEMQPDILALQEVDGRVHLGRRPAAFETFAELLGGYIVEARLFGKPQREHGNLLWSRWPARRQHLHLLPGGLEQRGLIEAEFRLPIGPLRVFATHLGLSPVTRCRQAGAILRHVRSGVGPAIVVGDFNEWMGSGAVRRILARDLPGILQPVTWPAKKPVLSLDRMYASSEIKLELVAPPAAARTASDHLPVIADLRFRAS